jgi:adenylyltransferase/sulfurtransferase
VPSCAEGGVFGVLCGTVGAVMATEVLKLVCGVGEPLVGRLLVYDGLGSSWREIRVRPDPSAPPITELVDYEAFCGITEAPSYQGLEITPEELKRELEEKGDELVLIDVREPHEWEIAHIEEARLIPLGQLWERMHELDTADEIVLQCRSGARSARALGILQEAGFRKLKNLTGGILAWSEDVDPSLPKY